jgi:hypothetical protein
VESKRSQRRNQKESKRGKKGVKKQQKSQKESKKESTRKPKRIKINGGRIFERVKKSMVAIYIIYFEKGERDSIQFLD